MWPPKRPVRPKGENHRRLTQEEPGAAAAARRRQLEAQAQALLPSILAFLAAEPDRMTRFFDLTGLAAEDLRRAATTAAFAVSLVDYICADDRLVRDFTAAEGLEPARLDALHQALAAGAPE